MCFSHIQSESKPYNSSRIRYKSVEVVDGCIRSCYRSQIWVVGKTHHSKNKSVSVNDTKHNIGFHCFVTRDAAMRNTRGDRNEERVVIKIEVDGFIASGKWDNTTDPQQRYEPGASTFIKTETWKRAKVLQVICRGGRDITHRFIKK